MGEQRSARVAAVTIGLALVAAASGCAGTAANDSPPAARPAWGTCGDVTDERDALSLPRLADDFEPVAAFICRTDLQKRPGGGSEEIAVEERADDVTALVRALRLPDEKPTDGPCTLEAVVVQPLVLVDARGRWVRPGIPVDACRKPRQELRTALEQLRTERVSTRVLREMESDEAATAGCAQAWSDMVWATGEFGGGQAGTPGPLPADDAEIRLCVYRVTPGEQGGAKPRGDFESGGKLAPEKWVSVKRALAAAGPASACTEPSSRFAVLQLPAGTVYVEADGCRRVLIDTGTGGGALRQGPAELASLLVGK